MWSKSSPFSFLSFLVLVFFRINICTATNGLFQTQQIYQFPIPTVVENLAVRPDGSILTTIANRAEIYLIQPLASGPDPQLIYRFNGSKTVTGIVETSPDIFYVTVTSVTETLVPIANSSQLWRITFPSRERDIPLVSKVADLPRISTPNGLTSLPGGDRLLSADSFQGIVFIINTSTGNVIAALFDPLFNPTDPGEERGGEEGRGSFGVNGLEVFHDTLYFTNGAQKVFGKIPIDPLTGISLSSASTIAYTLSPTGTYDDFAVSPHGKVAFVATGAGNAIERIDLKTGRQDIVAGGINSTALEGPTSTAYGRKKNGTLNPGTLFVTTSGGQLVNFQVGWVGASWGENKTASLLDYLHIMYEKYFAPRVWSRNSISSVLCSRLSWLCFPGSWIMDVVDLWIKSVWTFLMWVKGFKTQSYLLISAWCDVNWVLPTSFRRVDTFFEILSRGTRLNLTSRQDLIWQPRPEFEKEPT